MKKSKYTIIGGGINGLFTAYHLSKATTEEIIIIDRSYLGGGSTFKCATGIRASFTTKEHITLMIESIKLWEKYSKKLGFWYLKGGYLWLFSKKEQLHKFREYSKVHNMLGLPTQIWDKEKIKREIPSMCSDHIIAGLYDPLAGKASPFEAVHSLYLHCKSKNVKFLTRTNVEKIKRTKEGYEIQTERFVMKTETLIIAAGSGTKKLLRSIGIHVPLKNIPHHSLITEPYRDVFKPLIIDVTTGAYLVQLKEGNFLMGVEVDEKEDSPLNERLDFMIKVLSIWYKYFPWIKNTNILRAWAGYYVVSPDHHPIIGPIEEYNNLYIAAGFSGHGFMMAPIVGKLLSEWILEGEPSIKIANNLTIRRFIEGKLIHEKAVIG